ncbi:hypothetical protein SAMN05428989_1434 [Pseudoxanthomonas sp. GM95]|uniref:N-acetyltransferase n=1 Tax=Pseudoxanthomonas sp. GM95 TaxID=1881043 RepID=UPI0008B1C86A|nr:N-acetyltransferase [Pseudoxanthomonas sp. GM95]SEL10147.1 hypothetical protein SAMN05428989_1434 [Pseudoxanthomonas sp. GM95]
MSELIAFVHEAARCRFVAWTATAHAWAVYEEDDGILSFVQTHHSRSAQDAGLVDELVRHCLATSRAEQRYVTPLCAAFFLYMEARPETHDLLSPLGLRLYSD